MKHIYSFLLILAITLLAHDPVFSQIQRILGATRLDLDDNIGSHIILTNASSSLGINSAGALPNVCALLDLASTTKGFLVPRMTSVQELALCGGTPPEGLIAYNLTTHTFDVYNGTTWGTASLSWMVTGNGGTNPLANFIGTTDAQDLAIRTNNVEALRVGSNGNVSIGTNSTSTYPLLVQRNFTSAGSVSDIDIFGNATYTPAGATTNHKVYGTYGQVGGSGALNLSVGAALVGAGGLAATNAGSTGSVVRMIGTVGSVLTNSIASVTTADGSVGEYAPSNGTITDAANFRAQSFPSGGTTTNLRGLYVTNMSLSGGTVTNQYGIDINQLSGAANNTAFRYNHPTQPILMKGNGDVQIGLLASTFNAGLIVSRTATSTAGSVVGSEAQLVVQPPSPAASFYIGTYSHADAANAVSLAGSNIYGLWGGAELFSTATAPLGNARGVLGELFYQTNQPLSDGAAFNADLDIQGTGTISTLSGLRDVFQNISGATITDLKLLNVLSLLSNTGTITNTYGLYIGTLTLGTQTNKPYSIFASDNSARSYLAGLTGFGNAGAQSPTSTVDITGTIAVHKSGTVTLGAGDFLIGIGADNGFIDITANIAGSQIGGISGGVDGRLLYIHSTGPGNLTINDEDLGAPATTRIHTMKGVSVTTNGEAMITLIYDSNTSRWLVVSIQD